jgi:hypothetical protein
MNLAKATGSQRMGYLRRRDAVVRQRVRILGGFVRREKGNLSGPKGQIQGFFTAYRMTALGGSGAVALGGILSALVAAIAGQPV